MGNQEVRRHDDTRHEKKAERKHLSSGSHHAAYRLPPRGPSATVGLKERNQECKRQELKIRDDNYNLLLRTSEIHLFYNLQVFYWHFIEILWLFIFLVLYLWYKSWARPA